MGKRAVYIGRSINEFYEIKALMLRNNISCSVREIGTRHTWQTENPRLITKVNIGFERLLEILVNEKDYKDACYLILRYKNFKDS